jgi:hypothetical protein
MISPSTIAKSIGSALLLALIFSFIWPLLPKEGVFSGLSWQLRAAVIAICGLIVIGPGQVAYDMVTDSGF